MLSWIWRCNLSVCFSDLDFSSLHCKLEKARALPYVSRTIKQLHLTLVSFQQYIRVMDENAQCTESGPFFPTTPRYVTQNGLAINQNVLKEPDWLVITLLLAAVFLATVVVIVALVGLSCTVHRVFWPRGTNGQPNGVMPVSASCWCRGQGGLMHRA